MGSLHSVSTLLHHSCKFFSCLRKPEPAKGLVTFLQSSHIFPFILTNSIKAAELRKIAKSASYLTTQPRQLSPTTEKTLKSFNQACPPSIFHLGRYSLVTFNQQHLHPQFPLERFTSIFQLGGGRYLLCNTK